MNQETWKPLAGYEKFYTISNFGKVKSIIRKWHQREHILKPIRGNCGYLRFNISKNGIIKNLYLHHLVALNFIGQRPKGYQVNHKDGVKLNNCVSNLEYITKSENAIHAYKLGLRKPTAGTANGMSNLSEKQIITIRNKYKNKNITQKILAIEYKTTQSNISLIVRKENWKHI